MGCNDITTLAAIIAIFLPTAIESVCGYRVKDTVLLCCWVLCLYAVEFWCDSCSSLLYAVVDVVVAAVVSSVVAIGSFRVFSNGSFVSCSLALAIIPGLAHLDFYTFVFKVAYLRLDRGNSTMMVTLLLLLMVVMMAMLVVGGG